MVRVPGLGSVANGAERSTFHVSFLLSRMIGYIYFADLLTIMPLMFEMVRCIVIIIKL